MTLQKHRETLTENDIEELISETVKLKEIQVPAARVAGCTAGRYSLGGMGGCQKFRDLKRQEMSLVDAVWSLFCGSNDFRHKRMSSTKYKCLTAFKVQTPAL